MANCSCVADLEVKYTALAAAVEDITAAVDSTWLLIATYLVFFMQTGFALLEAGTVRSKNTKSILLKNLTDCSVACIMYYLVGYGVATGETFAVIGDDTNFVTEEHTEYASFLFSWVFCSTTATIVSGSVASRILFSAYMIITFFVSVIIYPIVSMWVWGGGWLSVTSTQGLQMIDFAGSGVVHMVGGCCGLVAAKLVGARIGRYTMGDEMVIVDNKIEGHSIVLATMGTFFLWFGWYGFNPGSTLAMTGGQYLVAANASITTSLACTAGVLTSVLLSHLLDHLHNLWHILNSLLCALVAITACAATVPPWAAIIIGIIAAIVYRGAEKLVSIMRIDDVVNAFALHGCGGITGLICAGLFSTQENIDLTYGKGVLDYSVGKQLGVQLIGCVAIFAWCILMSVVAVLIAKVTVGLRVKHDDEVVGLDFKYHAGYAYPDFNRKVKKAREQIALERALARKVRKKTQKQNYLEKKRGSKYKT